MCGIIGILGERPVSPLLLDGLRRLEYRGYDSAGIATLTGGRIGRRRAQGKLINLAARLEEDPLAGTTGIGHTRWATHGRPTETNAHPHATDRVAVVHNGIIENFRELRAELEGNGHRFVTETDTETIAHLIDAGLAEGLTPAAATAAALERLEGAFALAVIFTGHPDLMIGARRGSPLAAGFGPGEVYLGSDAMALGGLTSRICYLEEGDRVELSRAEHRVFAADGRAVDRPIDQAGAGGALTGKGNYRHFMLKEIHEQPAVIGDTLRTYLDPATGRITLPEMGLDFAAIDRLTAVSCGTAYFACLVAKYWFEQIARLPVDVDIASEFRYRAPPLAVHSSSLVVSQSGETADTLAALRYAKGQGQSVLSVVNVPHSTIARESRMVLPTLAGPEIGVASTKAFTTQLAVLACLAIEAARQRGAIDAAEEARLVGALREIPARAARILAQSRPIEQMAHMIAEARDVLYLGRGVSYPMALEGALKLKEISYIHAEGYAAGEMKHGPIALIDENVPVVVLAPDDGVLDKTLSNVEEVLARGGRVILIGAEAAIARAGDRAAASLVLPAVDPLVSPILYALPVQLLAYYTAVLKGTDVDQPRNLAKSVTVE